MSAYKPFTTSDVVVTPFKVNKSFTFKGASEFTASNVGIDRFFGKNTPYISGSNLTGEISTQNQTLIYESTKQLYYSNFLFGQDGSPANLPQFNTDGTITIQGGSGSYQPMYDNYLPDTLDANRLFPTASNDRIGIISIPSNLFGENIKPGTFEYVYTGSSLSGKFNDDENGNLGKNGSKVGDIIYQHGIISFNLIWYFNYRKCLWNSFIWNWSLFTAGALELDDVISSTNITCSFQSTTTIFESQYKCTLRENEFNYTQNPSAISGSSNSGIVYNFLTGSYFEPYITSVGLYNNANELVAVGKLSQPLQSSNTTDTTILVNLDL